MNKEVIFVYPRISAYNQKSYKEQYWLKTQSRECIDIFKERGFSIKFIMEDELCHILNDKEDSCEWITMITPVDRRFLMENVEGMRDLYKNFEYKQHNTKICQECVKEVVATSRDKCYDDIEHLSKRIVTIQHRVQKSVRKSVPRLIPAIVHFASSGVNNFMQPPIPIQGDECIMCLVDLDKNSRKFYYTGMEVSEEEFKFLLEGIQ